MCRRGPALTTISCCASNRIYKMEACLFFTLRRSVFSVRGPSILSFPSHLGSVRPFSSRFHIDKPRDLYGVLGVSPSATQQQVKEAFYDLSMKYHPDRNMGSLEAHKRFTDITEAYSVLGQFELRKKYDKGLLQDYPRKAQTTTPPPGPFKPRGPTQFVDQDKVKFNFDEYYRAHYGDALKRQRQEKKEAEHEKFRATFYTVPESVQRVWMMTASLTVLLLGMFFGPRLRSRN